MLDSDNLRRELGACGRRRIEENLNWENERRSLLEAYATALGR
jgi:glycosyltransferase involved in cell wall biosynthesis